MGKRDEEINKLKSKIIELEKRDVSMPQERDQQEINKTELQKKKQKKEISEKNCEIKCLKTQIRILEETLKDKENQARNFEERVNIDGGIRTGERYKYYYDKQRV